LRILAHAMIAIKPSSTRVWKPVEAKMGISQPTMASTLHFLARLHQWLWPPPLPLNGRRALYPYGILRIISGETGIMLVFMWYITHNEPTRAIRIITRVNSIDMTIQPPSDERFMCKK